MNNIRAWESFISMRKYMFNNMRTHSNGLPNLYICGSASRMISANYMCNKIAEQFKGKYNIFLFLDDFIFHNSNEYVITFDKDQKISYRNSQVEFELNPEQESNDIKEWFNIWVKNIYKLSNGWYDYCKNILLRASYFFDVDITIKEWLKLDQETKYYILKKIDILDNNYLFIDICYCSICNKKHLGPFKKMNGKVILPCMSIQIDRLIYSSIRIKKGYLQLVPALLNWGMVLVPSTFFYKYRQDINLLGLQNSFLLQEKETNNILLRESIINLYDKVIKRQNLVYDLKNSSTWDLIDLYYGKELRVLLLTRHYLRIQKNYMEADKIRQFIMNKFSLQIRDEKEGRYTIIAR